MGSSTKSSGHLSSLVIAVVGCVLFFFTHPAVGVCAQELPPPGLKIAFIGDQGLRSDALAVLNLIKLEGAEAVMHSGDIDCANNPAAWDAHAIVEAEINGASGAMLLDTGKSLTGVDARFASKTKVVGYSSRVGTLDAAGALSKTELAKLKSFKIGGVSLRAPDVRLENFLIYTQTSGKLIGFLGIDILGPNGAIIDFGNLKLYCYPL